MMDGAIRLAQDIGIRTTIQLAGYDVYYEEHDEGTVARFAGGAEARRRTRRRRPGDVAVEIMDTPFINSIGKWREWEARIGSPWFTVYPDLGNLSAWGNDVPRELLTGIERIAAIHLKETMPVGQRARGSTAVSPSARAASISSACSARSSP